jgi:hypothetical protein
LTDFASGVTTSLLKHSIHLSLRNTASESLTSSQDEGDRRAST